MKKILIIHTAFIGDIVLSTPLIKKIKQKYNNSEIYYLTTTVGGEIVKNNPMLKGVIVYDKKGKDKGLKGLIKIIRDIKNYNFDIAIIPHRYLRSTLIAFLAGIKERIGYSNSEGKLFLTKKIEYVKSVHEVKRLLNLIELSDFKDDKIELYPGKEDIKKVDEIWGKFELDNQKIVVIAPGSKWFTKMWPIEYYNLLLKKLEKLNIKVLLIGGKEEEKLNIIETSNTVNLIGKTKLLELVEIFKRSTVLVSNDSSPLHIAAATDIYIIAIFGATTKELGFYPWTKNYTIIENSNLDCRPCGLHGGNECKEGHFKCMKDISPDEVYDEIVERLERRI
ncbi:lipopolysaccharide heptosyltransferase II [Haliovirga abyssi]|uniref:lipopolysaccharide heptosyltransferase II n=1 Tax=Haliovirga abyssi TaxID=2996794 RepID=A0AAU9DNC5_9FUSO|nr:lipopolysaccharide heptosyltransferase II [Haliovirga abyssi]BDU49843.1 ADP-heptose--LPS heptosyltransferase II [Haliovirga abyssi]